MIARKAKRVPIKCCNVQRLTSISTDTSVDPSHAHLDYSINEAGRTTNVKTNDGKSEFQNARKCCTFSQKTKRQKPSKGTDKRGVNPKNKRAGAQPIG
jgi:hypothetical protein